MRGGEVWWGCACLVMRGCLPPIDLPVAERICAGGGVRQRKSPVSTGEGTRRVRLVRGGEGGKVCSTLALLPKRDRSQAAARRGAAGGTGGAARLLSDHVRRNERAPAVQLREGREATRGSDTSRGKQMHTGGRVATISFVAARSVLSQKSGAAGRRGGSGTVSPTIGWRRCARCTRICAAAAADAPASGGGRAARRGAAPGGWPGSFVRNSERIPPSPRRDAQRRGGARGAPGACGR
jgi:hypothetical protein